MDIIMISKCWKKHNLDGYVCLICLIGADHLPNIVRRYKYNGKLHRKDKPAIEHEGVKYFKFYWVNGIQHREDGPARISASEDEYYYEGKKIFASSDEEFKEKIRIIKLKVFLWK